jgi:hypothetical protein
VIWSKLRKALDELLCETLRGRVQYHYTRYGPGFSHVMTRAWITVDKQELVYFSAIESGQQADLARHFLTL